MIKHHVTGQGIQTETSICLFLHFFVEFDLGPMALYTTVVAPQSFSKISARSFD